MNALANTLLAIGVVVLIGTLIPVRRLIRRLPAGPIARRWHILTVLILLFVVGYLTFGVAFWGTHNALSSVIVPAVFLLGALFVWAVAALSLRTASDLRRVALLERENITDPLTGIYNRRYLDRRLEEEVVRARRYSHPLSLLMLDVDHFKRINDEYGHHAGDGVLRFLGELIMGIVRGPDVVARYGGEELVVISPEITRERALALAERLRENIEAHEFVLTSESAPRQAIRVTVSIGVAALEADVPDAIALMRRADEALYSAKAAGRNQVRGYVPSQSDDRPTRANRPA
jgi:diguanylate cyclase (GGDEF)-like protein